MRYLEKLTYLFLLPVLIAGLFGCAAKKKSSGDVTMLTPQRESAEMNPDAYHHFTSAVIYEQEGMVDAALKEYELALSYQPLSYDIRMALGELYFRINRPNDALNAVLPIPSKDGEAYKLVGNCLNRLGRHTEARSAYLKALADLPDDIGLNYNLGMYAADAGEFDQAADYLKVAANSAGSPDLYDQIAEMYGRRGVFDSAAVYFKAALQAGGNDPALYGKLAFNHAGAGNMEEARKVLRDGISTHPEALRLQAQLIETYSADKNLDSVKTISERLLVMESNDFFVFEQVGQVLLSNKFDQLARRCFEKALGINKLSNISIFYLGKIALEEEKLDTARYFFSELTEIDPAIPDGWMNLAFVYEREEQSKKAINVLIEALDNVTMQRDDLRSYLSQLLARSEMRDSAVAILKGAILEGGDTVRALFNIGALYETMDEFDKAVETFELLLSIDNKHAPTLNYLGYMLADRNTRLDEALVMIERALEVDSSNGAYLDSYAWVFYRMGKYQEALEQIERATVLIKDDPIVAEHLGDIHQALGNTAAAHRAWEEALNLDPDNQELKKKLGLPEE